MDRGAEAGPRSRRNWLGWGLALFILVGCAIFLDLGEVIAIVAGVHPAALVGILALMTVDRVLMAWKWTLLLRVVGVNLPLSTIVRYYYQGTLSGTFMPSMLGGDLLRAHWVAQASGVTHPVFAALLMERMIGFLSAINWGILGAVIFACIVYEQRLWTWVALGGAGSLLLILTFFLSLHATVHGTVLAGLRFFGQSRVLGLLHRLYEAYSRFGSAQLVVAQNIALTIGEQLLQMTIFLLVARSLEIDVGVALFLALAAIHILINRIPISPDGWGVMELTAIGLFGLIGIGPEAAFSLTFLSHVLNTVVVLPGFWFLLQRRRHPFATTTNGESDRRGRARKATLHR